MLKIIENRYKFFLFSLAIIVIGIIVAVVNAVSGRGLFNYDVEFSGGISIIYDAGVSDFKNDAILDIVKANTPLTSAQIQKNVGTTEVNIRIKNITQEERAALIGALNSTFENGELLDMQDVSPTVSGEMKRSAIISFLSACVLMLIYVSFRFKDIWLGGSSILALVHDGLIVLSAYAILRIPLNTAFIAAILTVLGYSINATIVIFDRSRENKRLLKKADKAELVNTSVTQTLTRSIYTSLTTLLTISCLYIMGVSSMKDFTLPIIIGIIFGTYSSICLAGSIWYTLSPDTKR